MQKGGVSELDLSSYKEPLYEKPAFHYAMFFLIMASLVVSVIAMNNTNKLMGAAVAADAVSVDVFLEKLNSHEEMKAYVGTAPLNIIQINKDNLADLQTQIDGLDASYIGNFIVQYADSIVIYDYANDELKSAIDLQQPQAQLPDDFFAKLNSHPELKGLENEQPIGGPLDEESLINLRQQFPDVYANAKVGDFLLRYTSKLIIYDYPQDAIVNSVNLN